MRILVLDERRGTAKLRLEGVEDVYYLYSVLSPGDYVRVRTARKVKGDSSRPDSGERIPMTLTLEVEKLELNPEGGGLRILGIIREGPEKYGIQGKHHAVTLGPNQEVSVRKTRWEKVHTDLLREAEGKSQRPRLIAVVLDERRAMIAPITDYRIEKPVEIVSKIPGKAGDRQRFRDREIRRFFEDVAATIVELQRRHGEIPVLVAGPGFFKEEFLRYLSSNFPELSSHCRLAQASTATRSGLRELVRRGEVAAVVRDLSLAEDAAAVDELMRRMARGSRLVAYGEQEVREALTFGAADLLLLTSKFVFSDETREVALKMLEEARSTRCRHRIVDSSTEPGEILDGLGGVAALLRFDFTRSD